MTRIVGIDSTALAFIANLLIVVTVVCAVALAAARYLYRRNPSARHTVCLAGVFGVLLAPPIVLAVSGTNFGFELLRLTHAPIPAQSLRFSTGMWPRTRSERVVMQGASHWRPFRKEPRPSRFVSWILTIWFVGSAFGVIRLAHGLQQASRYRRTAQHVDPGVLISVLTGFGGHDATLPPIMKSRVAQTPMAAGVFHPAVIVPEQLLATLTPLQLRHVLAHELTHIRLRHGISGFAQRLAGVLFWPHPLVGALCAALSEAREEICDNVASQDDGAACYARTLLAVAEQIRYAPILVSSGLAFLGPGTSLEDRIAGLLDPRRIKQVELQPSRIWAITGALVITILGAAGLRVRTNDMQSAPNAVSASPPRNITNLSSDAVSELQIPDTYTLRPMSPLPRMANLPPLQSLPKHSTRLPNGPYGNTDISPGVDAWGTISGFDGVGDMGRPTLADVMTGMEQQDTQRASQKEQADIALAVRDRIALDLTSIRPLVISGPITLADTSGEEVSAAIQNLESLQADDVQVKSALDDFQTSTGMDTGTGSIDGGIDTQLGEGGGTDSDGGNESIYNSINANKGTSVSVTYTTTGDTIAQVLSRLGMQTGGDVSVGYTLQAVGATQNGAVPVIHWHVVKPQ